MLSTYYLTINDGNIQGMKSGRKYISGNLFALATCGMVYLLSDDTKAAVCKQKWDSMIIAIP